MMHLDRRGTLVLPIGRDEFFDNNLYFSRTSTDMEVFDRFSRVSSLYGPGTVGCWLCTVASVFVTWTLNIDFRRRDSITSDLIAALAMPAVAASHVIFLLFFAVPAPSRIYFSRAELLSSEDPAIIQFAAAVEAPLNLCETFAAVALGFFPIAALLGNWKRAVSVMAVGLFCISVESIIFLQAPTVEAVRSNLARPYLFNFPAIMTSIFAFLGVALALSVVVLGAASVRVLARNGNAATTTEVERGARWRLLVLTRGESRLLFETLLMLPLLLSIVVIPLSTGSVFLTGTGLLGATQYMNVELPHWASRILFFIPRSGNDLSELDQAMSLAVGAVTLIFSVYDAYKTRRKTLTSQHVEEVELEERRQARRGIPQT